MSANSDPIALPTIPGRRGPSSVFVAKVTSLQGLGRLSMSFRELRFRGCFLMWGQVNPFETLTVTVGYTNKTDLT